MVWRRRSKAVAHLGDGVQVAGDGGERGDLRDVGDVGRGVRLEVGRGLDDVLRADDPAHPPAGHRVRLGDAVDDDALVAQLGHDRGQRGELRVAVDEVLVDLVGQHPQAVLDGPAADRLGLGLAVDGAGRVGRGDEEDDLGALGAGRLQLLDGDPVAGGLVGDDLDRDTAGEPDRLRVGGPVRRRDDDLVARVEDRGEGLVDRLLAAVGHQDLRRRRPRSRSRAASSRRSRPSARAARRPGCSGGTSGCGRPRPRPRRCSPGVGKSGSPAPKPITGRPAALRALALASTARVADSEIAPTRAETRRSVGGVAALMGPIVPDRKHARHAGFTTEPDCDGRTARSAICVARPLGRFCSTTGRWTTYTHTSLAFSGRSPVHTVHSVGCGTLGDAQRVVAQLVEHWSPKPAVGGSSPSGPATHTFARMCAHVRTAMHRRAAQPGAARPRPGIR